MLLYYPSLVPWNILQYIFCFEQSKFLNGLLGKRIPAEHQCWFKNPVPGAEN